MDKKKTYSLKESAITYIFSLVAVFGGSIFMTNLVSVVASIQNADINKVFASQWVSYVNMFLSATLFLLVYICLNAFKKKDFKVASKLKVKFDYKIFIPVIFLSVVIMLACVNITGLFNYVAGFFTTKVTSSNLGIEMNTFWQFLLVELLLAVLPAVCEELVFRGIIYNGLRQKFSTFISVLISSILFSLIHFSIYQTFFQIILGIILALLVYYTGTIFYSIVYHFVNNFTIILINYISPNKAIFEFSTWGVKEILLSILFFIIAVAIVFLFFAVLKNYTSKHKKYFNLETTNKPLGEEENKDNVVEINEVDESQENQEQKPQLSEYDKKLISASQTGISDVGWLVIGFVAALLIWSLNSFGGFL